MILYIYISLIILFFSKNTATYILLLIYRHNIFNFTLIFLKFFLYVGRKISWFYIRKNSFFLLVYHSVDLKCYVGWVQVFQLISYEFFESMYTIVSELWISDLAFYNRGTPLFTIKNVFYERIRNVVRQLGVGDYYLYTDTFAEWFLWIFNWVAIFKVIIFEIGRYHIDFYQTFKDLSFFLKDPKLDRVASII